MYTFSFIVGNIIPRSAKCSHSATRRVRVYSSRVSGSGVGFKGLGFSIYAASSDGIPLVPRSSAGLGEGIRGDVCAVVVAVVPKLHFLVLPSFKKLPLPF